MCGHGTGAGVGKCACVGIVRMRGRYRLMLSGEVQLFFCCWTMASSAPSAAETTPLTVGNSLLPKIPLSHRWVINDVEILLGKAKTLKGPSFSTPVPLKTFKEAFWNVSLQKKVLSAQHYLYLCLSHDSAATNAASSSDSRPSSSSVSMAVGASSKQPTSQSSRVIISDCVFSVLNLQTDEILFTITAPSVECEIGGKKRMVGFQSNTSFLSLCVKFCNYADVAQYVFDDTLVIQVSATILCYTDPSEVLEEGMYTIPLDNIRNELFHLFQEEFLADATIKCGDKEFKVHKMLLAAQSPVFKTMFVTDMSEKRSNVIEISDIEPVVMKDLLAYIYTGSAPHLSRLAKELLNAATKYEIPRLVAMCEEKLKKRLNASNVVETLLWANFLSAKLKGACLRFIHLHSNEVKRTSGWKHLKKNSDEYSSILVEIMEFTV